LTSPSRTSSSISLSWTASTDNVGVTAYRIMEGTTQVGSGAATSFTVTGLGASTTHTYRVTAVDAAGNVSAQSNAVTVTTEAGGPGPGPAGLRVQYRAGNQSVGDNQLGPHFQIVNGGTTTVTLSQVTMRYWYTVDGARPQTLWCDWTPRGCNNLSGTFVSVSPARAGADTYVEVRFAAGMGTLTPGQSTGEIQTRVSKDNWTNYNEAGDHSFDGTKTSFADWNRVTLYVNGALVWGVEPGSALLSGESEGEPEDEMGDDGGCSTSSGGTGALGGFVIGCLALLGWAGRRRRPFDLAAPLLAVAIFASCMDVDDEPDVSANSLAAVSGGGVTVDVITTEVWSTGFNGAVRVTNNAFPTPISSFEVVFRLNGGATIPGQAWNGNISAPDGSGNRTASNPSWLVHSPIRPGQSWDVGFTGSGPFAGATITALRMNGQNIPIGGDNDTPPIVSLTASATSVTVAGPLTLTANATDNVGVTRVEFRDGTQLIGTDTTAPYSFTINLTSAQNGTHSYTARAFDTVGNSANSAPVSVNVNIGGNDTPPIVSLTASATSVTVAGPLTLTANATDNVGVTRVEFRDGAQLIGTDTTAPYSFTVNLTSAQNGTHSYTARAFDTAGNSATSAPVSVTVNIGGSPGRPVYSTSGGRLFRDGAEIRLFGLNWFGLETPDRVLHGLWTGRQLSVFLTDIKSKGFNALRLPVSPQTINAGFPISMAGPAVGEDGAALSGRDGRTALEYTLSKAQAAGVFVLVDFHTCDPARLGSSLPGSPINCGGYSQANWIDDMRDLATLSLTYTNMVGIDLTNEPHQLTWSTWAGLVGQASQAILAINPGLTIWVEGVGNASNTGGFAANWGQNLHEAAAISGVPANRLVFSPHSYGPSVAVMDYFSAPTYPENMPGIWDTLFGHLYAKGFTVVTGEFGGHYTTSSQESLDDKLWQDRFVDYSLARGARSFFYWAVNPNSGDTGGVYGDDWTTWNQAKLTLLQRLMN
jgi:aryl-phospho-beta-D-glucosidase BglC (GH1 family)